MLLTRDGSCKLVRMDLIDFKQNCSSHLLPNSSCSDNAHMAAKENLPASDILFSLCFNLDMS